MGRGCYFSGTERSGPHRVCAAPLDASAPACTVTDGTGDWLHTTKHTQSQGTCSLPERSGVCLLAQGRAGIRSPGGLSPADCCLHLARGLSRVLGGAQSASPQAGRLPWAWV